MTGFVRQGPDFSLADALSYNPKLGAQNLIQRLSKLHALALNAAPIVGNTGCIVPDDCARTFTLGGPGAAAATSVCEACMPASKVTALRSKW